MNRPGCFICTGRPLTSLPGIETFASFQVAPTAESLRLFRLPVIQHLRPLSASGFIATDHPSCSKQHAVIQFRLHEYVAFVSLLIPFLLGSPVRSCWMLQERERRRQFLPQCKAVPHGPPGYKWYPSEWRTNRGHGIDFLFLSCLARSQSVFLVPAPFGN